MDLIIEHEGASSKIALEDETVRLLVTSMDGSLGDLTDTRLVCSEAERVLRNYAHRPHVVDDRHKAAMAILRAEAMKQAAQCAAPGELWELQSRADCILEHILGSR